MSNYNYEIRLRPVENYFFGGERTFGEAGDKQRNYFAVSNFYPQQTALLGLLRYLLLEDNQLLPLKDHKAEAASVIGARSFDVTQDVVQDFGVIKSLSPLFLKKEDEVYRFAHPLDQLRLETDTGGEVLGANGQIDDLIQLAGFDVKTYYPDCLVAENGTCVNYDKVFSTREQIGILKQSEKEGFFKQRLCQLSEGWDFVCYGLLEGDFRLSEDTKVSFGAERKQFFVKIKSIESNNLPSFLTPSDGDEKLTLLSDALVDSSIYDHCRFSLSDTVEFRSGKMAYDGAKYSKDEYRSNKHNLLKRGGILVPKDGQMAALELVLNQNENFSNIGFNQYFKSNL
ncbi:MAG: type III-B CRISPR module-associated Cmr3 family protein [Bacteroidota bacterium]